MLSLACEDMIRVFRLPEGGVAAHTAPITTLTGHGRKVTELHAHPVASGIMASASQDATVQIWDVERSTSIFKHEGPDNTFSFGWNANGSQLVSFQRDRKLRVLDARTPTVAATMDPQCNAKPGRCLWLCKKNLILSCTFSKQSNRQIALWFVIFCPRIHVCALQGSA